VVGRGGTLLAAALVAAVVGGVCSSAVGEGGSSGDPWRVVHAPFRIDVLVGSRVVTSVGGAEAPLTYQTKDGAQHQLTHLIRTTRARGATTYTVATDQAGRTASVSTRAIARGMRVSYAVSQPASVAALGLTLAASPAAHFLGTGQRVRWVDMRKTVVPLKVWNNCSSSPSGLFVSNRGFGGWIESTAVGRIAFPGAVDDSNFACDVGTTSCSVGPPVPAVRVCLRTAQASFDIVRGTIPEVLRLHAAARGFPRKPWLPEFELIKWRDRITSAAELLDDIDQLRSRRLPIGWVLLDNPWETGAQRGCYGALAFDPAIYPNPRKLIDQIHALGVRFMLWISPQIQHKGCSPPSVPDGYLTGNDEVFVRDLTNPGERRDFVNALRGLVDLGVDGFKGDRGDEVNLEPDELTGGPGTLLQNAYTRLYAQAAVDAFAARHGANFGALYRSFGYDAAPLLPGTVGPDEPQTSNGLEGAIRAAQTAGVTGATVWGSDVGGYSGGELTAGLFVRWAQFAALTPIFEVGGAGANATFWELGAAAVDGLRRAATLHYELVPYLYELATEAHATALPVIRPLGLGWPKDSAAWRHDLEFTIGRALLAAPVVSPSGQGASTTAV